MPSGHGLEAKAADEPDTLTWSAAMAATRAYGSGWHLPNKNELNLLYQQKTVVRGFTNDYYWSSSEDGNYDAWLQDFGDGQQSHDGKDTALRVRAVRAFLTIFTSHRQEIF
ncbi:MAG: Lcl C-terminal domain-containing protein [Methylobacter sp.]